MATDSGSWMEDRALVQDADTDAPETIEERLTHLQALANRFVGECEELRALIARQLDVYRRLEP